jgi:hypothetical protein
MSTLEPKSLKRNKIYIFFLLLLIEHPKLDSRHDIPDRKNQTFHPVPIRNTLM